MVKTITGTYGRSKRKTLIYVYTEYTGLNWYTCHGSKNVNATYDELQDGVNVEKIEDIDHFVIGNDITSTEQLKEAVEW